MKHPVCSRDSTWETLILYVLYRCLWCLRLVSAAFCCTLILSAPSKFWEPLRPKCTVLYRHKIVNLHMNGSPFKDYDLFSVVKDDILFYSECFNNALKKSRVRSHSIIIICTVHCTVVHSTVQLILVSGLWCSVPGQSWAEHQLLSLSHPES